MAIQVDELRAVMRMELSPFMKDLQKMHGITAQSARRVEAAWESTNARLNNIGRSMAQGLIAPMTAVGAALSADSVMHYADAWTSAKNSLAVAGVVGEQQARVLDKLYDSAQDNAAPIGALAGLFGKASQASDVLGATQGELLKFTDGVATALKIEGKSASEASGALTQLGQLLGSTRVQAEEFNSVNDGARPILMAVANGLEEAGGSVSKLKELVNDGKVSGQQFFQAFLKGLPSIEKMAANSTQTIEQGVTKVNNAFTKYIGQTDESLSASQRLVVGLNALADNFEQTADVTLKVASLIAAALVGRAIGGMIASLGLATAAVGRFVVAMRAAATMSGLAAAMGGLTAAAGPIGAVVGVTAVGALALFASTSATAAAGARTYADALEEVERRADGSAEAVDRASKSVSESTKNGLLEGIANGVKEIEDAKASVLGFYNSVLEYGPMPIVSDAQLKSLEDLRNGLSEGTVSAGEVREALYKLANTDPNFQWLADQMSPLLAAMQKASDATDILRNKMALLSGTTISDDQIAGYKQYAASRKQGEEMVRLGKEYADEAQRQNSLSKEQLAIEKEIASIKKDLKEKGGFLPEDQIKAMATSNVAADSARSKEGKTKSVKQTADSRFDGDIQAVRDRTAALIQEQQILSLSYEQQEKRRMALDLEQSALADLREEARRKGETDLESIKLSPEQVAAIDAASAAYAKQADVLRQVEEAQSRTQDAAKEFYDTAKSGFAGVVKGTESLGDALSNLADKLADLVLNSAFDGLFGGSSATSSGGWLTNLFKAVGFADGGYTGSGGKYAPAGVVHKGEYVFDQDSVRRAGGPGVLDALRAQLKGYANGGAVGYPTLPSIGSLKSRSGVTLTYAPQIDARGADVEAVARLERAMAKQKAEMQAQVEAAVRDANKRNVKLR